MKKTRDVLFAKSSSLYVSLYILCLECIYYLGDQDCIIQSLNCLLYLEKHAKGLGLYMPLHLITPLGQ